MGYDEFRTGSPYHFLNIIMLKKLLAINISFISKIGCHSIINSSTHFAYMGGRVAVFIFFLMDSWDGFQYAKEKYLTDFPNEKFSSTK